MSGIATNNGDWLLTPDVVIGVKPLKLIFFLISNESDRLSRHLLAAGFSTSLRRLLASFFYLVFFFFNIHVHIFQVLGKIILVFVQFDITKGDAGMTRCIPRVKRLRVESMVLVGVAELRLIFTTAVVDGAAFVGSAMAKV